MTIQVRKMQNEDLEQVLKLCDEVREHHRNILGGYFAPQNDEMEKSVLLDTLGKEGKFSLVALDGDNIVGMLLAEMRQTPWLETPKIANIFNFGVFEKARGQGIAKLLMNAFIEKCKKENIKEIKLGVFNKNISAYNFYKKYGFEDQEQRMSFKIK